VHGWLALHTQGINSPNVGETRGRIAEKLTPPYDSATAAHIGGLIRGVIDQGNRVAVKLSFTEIMASAVISDLYKKDQ
jgi:hypothetical protein